MAGSNLATQPGSSQQNFKKAVIYTFEYRKLCFYQVVQIRCLSLRAPVGGGRGGDPLTEGSGLINNLTFFNASNLIANERNRCCPLVEERVMTYRSNTSPSERLCGHVRGLTQSLGDSGVSGRDAFPGPKRKEKAKTR